MSRLARIEVEHDRVAPVVRVVGEVDLSNAEEIGREIAQHAPPAGSGVIVDLSEVSYLDSAGVHLVFRLSEELERRGGRLVLVVSPVAVVERVLEVAGVDRLVQVSGSVDEALAALQPSVGGAATGSTS